MFISNLKSFSVDAVKTYKPSTDLHDLPNKLIGADFTERRRLLIGLHERMLHVAPADMVRMLSAMMLPRDIVSLGAQVAAGCEDCRKWRPRTHKMALQTRLASTFNE